MKGTARNRGDSVQMDPEAARATGVGETSITVDGRTEEQWCQEACRIGAYDYVEVREGVKGRRIRTFTGERSPEKIVATIHGLKEQAQRYDRAAAGVGEALAPKMPRYPAYVCRDECQDAKAGKAHCAGQCRIAHPGGVGEASAPCYKHGTDPGCKCGVRCARDGVKGTHELDGWKEAAIAWTVCASIHREYAKGKDGVFKTRQADFLRHAEDARQRYLAGVGVPDEAQALADMRKRKDDAYEERNKVVAALARVFPSGIARTAIEGWSDDWHGCVYIDLPTGQVSWHFHDSQAHLFAGLPPYAGEWDGHDTPEKYRRLAALGVKASDGAQQHE
jgi:hypothetical protein